MPCEKTYDYLKKSKYKVSKNVVAYSVFSVYSECLISLNSTSFFSSFTELLSESQESHSADSMVALQDTSTSVCYVTSYFFKTYIEGDSVISLLSTAYLPGGTNLAKNCIKKENIKNDS